MNQDHAVTSTSRKRRLTGTVVSAKMKDTAVVAVAFMRQHPRYLKFYRRTTKFKADDKGNRYQEGDRVIIEETRPLSKDKRWRIVEKITEKRAPSPDSLNPIP